jgi:hypothetical protein
MKKSAAVLATALVLAISATASASPYNRNCGTPQDGWSVGQGASSHNYETPL